MTTTQTEEARAELEKARTERDRTQASLSEAQAAMRTARANLYNCELDARDADMRFRTLHVRCLMAGGMTVTDPVPVGECGDARALVTRKKED